MINDFDFVQARDVSEALEALTAEGRVIPVAGGTNVLVNMKRAPLPADLVLDLTRIEALEPITADQDQLRLGANVNFARLLDWAPGGPLQELIRPMCIGFAGPLIRNLATIGGNVCDASPAADVSPVLLALDAQVELESAADGTRVLALPEFFQGVRRTARRSDELLTSIYCDRPRDDERVFYYKLGKRRADAISIVSVAVRLRLEAGKVEMARIALGAVAPVAMRATEAEAALLGEPLNERAIAEAASTAAHEAQPIDDFRSGGAYRRQMVETLVARGLNQIAAQR
jgi:CO/xanthine dehydrogenase FAD-binding subunit